MINNNLQFFKGESKNLYSKEFDQGSFVLTTDTNDFYYTDKGIKKAKNKIFEWKGENKPYDFFIHQRGWELIIRSRNSKRFYRVCFKPSNNKEVTLDQVTLFMEKISDDRYRILGDIALKKLKEIIDYDETTKTKNRLDNKNSWVYDEANETITNKVEEEGRNKYYLAYWVDVKYNDTQIYLNGENSGHFNCLTHHKKTDIFFSATGLSSPKLKTYKYDKNNKIFSLEDCTLCKKDSTSAAFLNNTTIWEIAIELNKNILYVLAGHKIYEFNIPEDFSTEQKRLHRNSKAALSIGSFFNEVDIYGDNRIPADDEVRKYFTYQGMAVDDKYFYLPVIKTIEDYYEKTSDFNCQCLDVRLKNDPRLQPELNNGYQFKNGNFIHITNTPYKYELEDIEFIEGYMFLSFTNINSGYISKVYKIPFNNNYLPGKIDLLADSEDMWIIPMYSPNKVMMVGENQTETWDLANFKNSQGFTIGWNEKYGYYFSHGHNNIKGDTETTTIMTLSYINDNAFNPAKEYDEEPNLIKLFTNPSIKVKEYKTYYSKQTTIKPTEYPPPHELWTEEEPEDFEEESIGAWIDCIVYMDGHYEYSDVNELITTNDIDIICNS